MEWMVLWGLNDVDSFATKTWTNNGRCDLQIIWFSNKKNLNGHFLLTSYNTLKLNYHTRLIRLLIGYKYLGERKL